MAGVDDFLNSETNPSCENEMNQDVQKAEWAKIHLFGAYSKGDYTKAVHRIGLLLIGGAGVAILTSAAAISMMNKMDEVKPVIAGAFEGKVAKAEKNTLYYDFDIEYKTNTDVSVELSQPKRALEKETYTCLYEEEKENRMKIEGTFSLVKGHYDLRVFADFTFGKTLMITYSGYMEE